MVNFTRVFLVVLGLLSFAGGVYGAVDSWQSELSLTEKSNRSLALANALMRSAELIGEGRFGEAAEVEAKARLASPIPTDLEIELSRYVSAAWLASGLVSWALFWALAAIISELTLLRALVARELELAPQPGETAS